MECTVLLKTIGERVRKLRKAQKISQEALAELSCLHPVFISKVETGKVRASICTYQSIADALGTNLAVLVQSSEEGSVWENDLSVLFEAAKRLQEDKRNIFIETARGVLKGLDGGV